MEKDILLYMHAGSGNHGCEAIANTVCTMLKKNNPDDKIHLLSYRGWEDEKYSLSKMCDIIEERSFDKHKLAHVLYYIKRKITHNPNVMMRFRYKDALRLNPSFAISIGGDNYCYDSMLNDLRIANGVFKEDGVKTVLLGCSIEPELLKRDDILKDLGEYDTIIARESITYEALVEAFSKKEASPKVILIPDPAFTLKTNDVDLPNNFIVNNTVGINISPIVQSCESGDGITLKAYEKLIKYILDNTDMNIALIPHVVWNGNDDREPIEKLFLFAKEIGYESRVVKINDNDASNLKGYISKLRFFIGARTHATIAAYSSLVPTLVVGYSVKARGIAKDLFPDINVENMVIEVQKIKEENALVDAFSYLMDNEADIKNQLANIIPEVIEKAWKMQTVLGEM